MSEFGGYVRVFGVRDGEVSGVEAASFHPSDHHEPGMSAHHTYDLEALDGVAAGLRKAKRSFLVYGYHTGAGYDRLEVVVKGKLAYVEDLAEGYAAYGNDQVEIDDTGSPTLSGWMKKLARKLGEAQRLIAGWEACAEADGLLASLVPEMGAEPWGRGALTPPVVHPDETELFWDAPDLWPVAQCQALRQLWVNDSKVRDLRPLRGLPSLQELHLGGAKLTSLVGLEEATTLETLDMAHTRVRDLAPIAELPSLLQLVANGVPTLTDPPRMRTLALERLNLGGCKKVASIAGLAELVALRGLELHGTSVTDLAPLADLERLEVLNCHWLDLEGIEPLRRLNALRELDLDSTGVESLDPLDGCVHLASLNLIALGKVRDLGVLAQMTGLQKLWMDGVGAHDLTPLGPLTSLTHLWLADMTALDDLGPLAGCTSLEYLDLRRTHLTDLEPLRGLPALRTVEVRGSRIGQAQRDAFAAARPDIDLR